MVAARRGDAGEHEPGVLVFAPAAPLNFTNAERICGGIVGHCCPALAGEATGHRGNAIIDIDYTGSQILYGPSPNGGRTASSSRLPGYPERGAACKPTDTGLIEAIGPDRVFMSVEEAVRKLGPLSPPTQRSG